MESQYICIMHKDIPVLKFNIDSGVCIVLNENLLPYSLKGSIMIEKSSDSTESILKIRRHNQDRLIEYLSRRVLALSRKNVKKNTNCI